MGKTIVISSHILADLEEICTHIGILELGEVAWQGELNGAALSDAEDFTVVTIEVRQDQIEDAMQQLRSFEFVKSLTVKGPALELEIPEVEANGVLRHLLDANVEIVSFTRKKVDLESLFLARTRGIVS